MRGGSALVPRRARSRAICTAGWRGVRAAGTWCCGEAARRGPRATRCASGAGSRPRAGRAGAFYGGRTLLQLLRGGQPIPRGTARDWPRYPERGLMVDVGRKFFRALARSADPRTGLAEAQPAPPAPLRQPGLPGRERDPPRDVSAGAPDQGRRAADRCAVARRHHVTVVPEIDMPGHMEAALAITPSCSRTRRRRGRQARRHQPARARFALRPGRRAPRRCSRPVLAHGRRRVPARRPARRSPATRSSRPTPRADGPAATGKDAVLDFVNEIGALVRSRGQGTADLARRARGRARGEPSTRARS